MLLSSAIFDFYLFCDVPIDVQIWALVTRIQYRVFDTQVTNKARGSLVYLKKSVPCRSGSVVERSSHMPKIGIGDSSTVNRSPTDASVVGPRG